MRKKINNQFRLGEVDISRIELDKRSRDEIPQLLRGLQHIYCNQSTREKVFAILERLIPDEVDKNTGAPGMDLWTILVLGVVRLNCNWNYDKLKEMADNHLRIREMLGHCPYMDTTTYPLSTLKENVRLFTEETLKEINLVVVEEGHNLVKKKDEAILARCDSFPVESNVHYPTDINLLWDAMRKTIETIIFLCLRFPIGGWRQSKHNLRQIKNLYLAVIRAKRSKAKSQSARKKKNAIVKAKHMEYLELCMKFIVRAEEAVKIFEDCPANQQESVFRKKLSMLKRFIEHAHRQHDQTQRRVIGEEEIPHEEKMFSIFEEYTEWIVKGKAGISQELGLNVCVLEDSHGFILEHEVMQKVHDKDVAVDIVKAAKFNFEQLDVCSFDKGFHSPANQEQLNEIIETVVLPKKGRPAKNESSDQFKHYKKKHSAVESAINALENHGLDRCPDRGIDGFKRYVGLAVLGRNLQKLGSQIMKTELEAEKQAKARSAHKKVFGRFEPACFEAAG